MKNTIYSRKTITSLKSTVFRYYINGFARFFRVFKNIIDHGYIFDRLNFIQFTVRKLYIRQIVRQTRRNTTTTSRSPSLLYSKTDPRIVLPSREDTIDNFLPRRHYRARTMHTRMLHEDVERGMVCKTGSRLLYTVKERRAKKAAPPPAWPPPLRCSAGGSRGLITIYQAKGLASFN